ncbi:prolipoprotein diacylglyceryl transferase [Tichowtungia aerotolerans]|uniref:Phosphatidylglycerol--prolipoprotein diacylglyceryl transferase n=1 Tax=Tichowtungia aerotolerans TaxID=2697043 RepID=A0A6P1M4Q8_9BACT|nr:prolipoprotein diacylglyceryl transferase [Tichowtungia aerotolerans]QHI67983.1 prolipoprotein diacylglyceryl transferase [Tichowtungia aerotolerans]
MIFSPLHDSILPLFLSFWTHDLNPVIFHIWGPLAVRWYGLAYLLGFLGGYLILRRLSRRGEFAIPEQELSNFIVHLAIFGVFLGGRLGYVLFYAPHEFIKDPLFLLRVWEGGMASHGGIIGVIAFVLWTAWKKKVSFWNLTDGLALVAPIGLFFGRLANFINGELWGRPSQVAWAVIFPKVDMQPRHPSQLYEACGEGLLLFTALWLIHATPWGKRNGAVSACFLAIYALARITSEFFRTPDEGYALYLGWITKGQLYSAFMILGALAIVAAKKLYRSEKTT